MRMRSILGLTAATLLLAAPLRGQEVEESAGWELHGLRSGFCVQLLLDPASTMLRGLPDGYRAVPASAASDLHISLRSVIESQSEFAAWAPSRVCFTTADTVSGRDFQIADRKGRRPTLFGMWTVLAEGPAGGRQDVALELFTNNGRLVRSARFAGQRVDEARLTVGKVPAEDMNGVKSTDDRFQVKVNKATITWDGHPLADSATVQGPVRIMWTTTGLRGGMVSGTVELTPAYSEAMAGSLKVDGKSDFAKALRASPTRFAGPAYHGGAGKVTFTR